MADISIIPPPSTAMRMTKTSKCIYYHCAQASTLRVTIPNRIEGTPSDEGSDDFLFERVDVETEDTVPSTGREAHVVVKTVIRDTNHSTVYLGLVQGIPVILKCCYDIDFYKDDRLEVQVYKNHLQELQGSVVPVCFSYYLAIDELYGPYSLLLLQCCGGNLSKCFEDLEVKDRYAVPCLLSAIAPFPESLLFSDQS